MTRKQVEEIFDTELKHIRDRELRSIAIFLLTKLPRYFYDVAASSTGKYHPEYTQGDGGLLRHTKAAVQIAVSLMKLEQCQFNWREQDMIIISLLMHDGWKSGVRQHAYHLHEHPKIAAEQVDKYLSHNLKREEINFISSCIHCHMGEWNTHRKSDVILPKPRSTSEKFVHECDYLASRKFLEVNFEEV